MKKELAKELIEFINESPTAYHGAHTVKSMQTMLVIRK